MEVLLIEGVEMVVKCSVIGNRGGMDLDCFIEIRLAALLQLGGFWAAHEYRRRGPKEENYVPAVWGLLIVQLRSRENVGEWSLLASLRG